MGRHFLLAVSNQGVIWLFQGLIWHSYHVPSKHLGIEYLQSHSLLDGILWVVGFVSKETDQKKTEE